MSSSSSSFFRPLQHLNTVSELYPMAWKHLEQLLGSRGKSIPDWPSWCFMPLARWYSIVNADVGVDKVTDFNLISEMGRLAAIGAWRYSQGCYRFDDDLFKAVFATELSGDLSADVLYRLPEWCVYIETPGIGWLDTKLYGFWAHLEWDINSGRAELRLLLDTERALLAFPVHLGNWSLAEAVFRMVNEASRQSTLIHKSPLMRAVERDVLLSKQLMPLISFLLYICSDEPDITGLQPWKPFFPEPVRTKSGWRLLPPDKPTIWRVGDQPGAMLKTCKKTFNV